MTNNQPTDNAEMDALFRRVDFAADEPALEERLWSKIQAKLADRELAEDELEELAAAGGIEFRYGVDSCVMKCGMIK
jgi:hypothetical protein